MAFAIDRDENGTPVCLYIFPPYEGKKVISRDQAAQLRIAAAYREQMYAIALKRGMDAAEASRFAAEQVEMQLIMRMRQQEVDLLKRKRK